MIYIAAILIVAGVTLFVAAPLTGESFWHRGVRGSTEAERLEHERELAMQSLRDLEFDREMGKLSDADYLVLKAPLEERALAAMDALGRLRVASASAVTPRGAHRCRGPQRSLLSSLRGRRRPRA
jgi:hypothetical protein